MKKKNTPEIELGISYIGSFLVEKTGRGFEIKDLRFERRI
jgi:hypothetical protein